MKTIYKFQICQKIQREQWTVVQDPQGRRGPYAYKGDQWVGFDDINSITTKVRIVRDRIKSCGE